MYICRYKAFHEVHVWAYSRCLFCQSQGIWLVATARATPLIKHVNQLVTSGISCSMNLFRVNCEIIKLRATAEVLLIWLACISGSITTTEYPVSWHILKYCADQPADWHSVWLPIQHLNLGTPSACRRCRMQDDATPLSAARHVVVNLCWALERAGDSMGLKELLELEAHVER